MSTAPFDPHTMLSVLERHAVDYVVIGGLAAALRGAPLITADLDLCPSADRANLERLALALRDLTARIRTDGVPDGLPFACDATFLTNVGVLNLVTRAGNLDLSFVPSGTRGYADLLEHAERLLIAEGVAPSVAALEDVIRSKEAANRPKDLAALPSLRSLLAEIRRRAAL
jgi:hypothetical protein